MIKEILSWLSGGFNVDIKTGDKIGNVNVKGNNNTIAPSLDQMRQERELQDKRMAMEILSGAERDLNYNGPGIGTPTSKFELEGLKKLIGYSGPYKLNEVDKASFELYFQNAGICNGRDGGSRYVKPCYVQAQSKQLKNIVEKYKQKIKGS